MISWQEILLRLIVSSILGRLVGIDREKLDQAARLRTHMIVSTSSTLMMLVLPVWFWQCSTSARREFGFFTGGFAGSQQH